VLISEFAKATGLPRDTVRYYERLGLLKPSAPRGSSNGYRDYTVEDVERATLIKLGRALGFTLREIKTLAQSMESNALTDAKKVAVMEEKIKQIEMRVEQMNAIKRYFQAKVRWIAAGSIGDSPKFRGSAAKVTPVAGKHGVRR
jgi:DNA-binding transcriptional MerR regulator